MVKGRSEEVKALKEKIKELKEELKRQKQHYEELLKEAAIKNAMMVSLWNAWKSGKLKECYNNGGSVRILADGSIMCRKEKEEESYVIEVGESAGK